MALGVGAVEVFFEDRKDWLMTIPSSSVE